jgi:hypothetical protein
MAPRAPAQWVGSQDVAPRQAVVDVQHTGVRSSQSACNPHAFAQAGIAPHPQASPFARPRKAQSYAAWSRRPSAAKCSQSPRPHRTSGGPVLQRYGRGARSRRRRGWMADGTRTRCLSYFPSALSPFPLSCHAQKMPSKGLQPSAPVASCFVRSVGAGGGEGGSARARLPYT